MDPAKISEEQPILTETQFTFSTEELFDKTKWSIRFDRHVKVAVVASSLCLLIWVIMAMIAPSASWPWLIYTTLVFGYTLSTHFYLFVRPQKEWLQLHTCFFVNTNLICFVTWICTGQWDSAWFLYPFFGLAFFLVPHYFATLYKRDYNRMFYIHLSLVCVMDLMLFMIWMDSSKGYPWFFYPIFALCIPLIVHWSCINYSKVDDLSKKIRLWKIHSLIYLDINLMLFVAWALSGGFPWFVIVHFVWGPFLAVHYHRYRRLSDSPPILPVSQNPQETGSQYTGPQYTGTASINTEGLPPPMPGYMYAQMMVPMNYPQGNYQPTQPMLYPQVQVPSNQQEQPKL